MTKNMISSLSLRTSVRDSEVVLPANKERVLAIIAQCETKQPGATQAFCEETNLRVQLVSAGLVEVADNLNLASPFNSLAA